MRLDAYMALCLGHPQHGYYATRDPLGAGGDFVTAPEISQMFGELVGAWTAQVWLDQGRPAPFVLAELGPGRGTLMRDALRATTTVAGFRDAAAVWLVETSPALRARQAATLEGVDVRWAGEVAALPEAPSVVIANEFLDALPIRQFQRADALWRERLVGIEGDGLGFVWGAARPDAGLDARFPLLADGGIAEVNAAAEAVTAALGARIARAGGAALLVDYGGWEGSGDTLQAVAGHAPADPLAAPGAADLTAHVRFRPLAEAARPVARPRAGAAGNLPRAARHHRAGAGAGARPGGAGARGDRRGASPLDPSGGNGSPLPGSGAGAGRCSAAARIRRMTLEILTSDLLAGTRHGFFSRRGGASSGIYAGLNCGPGSSDQREAVALNRARVASALELSPERLRSLRQVHSTQVVVVGPDAWGERPEADAAVTAEPGLALSVLTADCAPVLFLDPVARVIGAAHAGWRGALEGVLEAVLEAMARLGARPGDVRAAVGPTISQRAYEVGPDFFDRFRSEEAGYERFFVPGAGDRMHFDLPGFVLARLRAAGVGQAAWIGACTFSEPDRFFSFRRTTKAGEPDYGRLISAIRL